MRKSGDSFALVVNSGIYLQISVTAPDLVFYPSPIYLPIHLAPTLNGLLGSTSPSPNHTSGSAYVIRFTVSVNRDCVCYIVDTLVLRVSSESPPPPAPAAFEASD